MSAWQGGYETRRKPAAKKVCPDCYSTYFNEAAHLEACPGKMVPTGSYQCDRCLAFSGRGGGCRCGGQMLPWLRRAKGESAA